MPTSWTRRSQISVVISSHNAAYLDDSYNDPDVGDDDPSYFLLYAKDKSNMKFSLLSVNNSFLHVSFDLFLLALPFPEMVEVLGIEPRSKIVHNKESTYLATIT